MGENRGTLKWLNCMQAGLGWLQDESAGHASGPRPTLFEYPVETRDVCVSTDILGGRYYGHSKLLLFNELCRTK
jgi:hypothetical protein